MFFGTFKGLTGSRLAALEIMMPLFYKVVVFKFQVKVISDGNFQFRIFRCW